MGSELLLRFVKVAGKLRDVREFRSLLPKQRPIAHCPERHERITLRLGPIRRAHAAHRAGALCPAIQGETALHRAVKLHLASELQGRRFLKVQASCSGMGTFAFLPESRCSQTETWKFAKNWTRVELECQIEDIRPDIVLFNGSVAIGAIEVAVTHYADAEKASRYAELQLPWVEVAATEELIAEERPWSIYEPLPVLWDDEGCVPRCTQCEQDRKIHLIQAPDSEVIAWRIVDFYYPSGKSWRDRFEIRRVPEGQRIGAMLACKASDSADWNKIYQTPDGDSLDHLMYEVESYWANLRGRGAIIDSPMSWVHSPDPPGAENFEAFPRRYRKRQRDGVWFLPRNREQIRWAWSGGEERRASAGDTK